MKTANKRGLAVLLRTQPTQVRDVSPPSHLEKRYRTIRVNRDRQRNSSLFPKAVDFITPQTLKTANKPASLIYSTPTPNCCHGPNTLHPRVQIQCLQFVPYQLFTVAYFFYVNQCCCSHRATKPGFAE